MSIVYTWNVVQLDCFPNVNGVKDVINNIHWTLTGTDELNGKTYESYICGVQTIPQNPINLQCSCDGMTLEQAIDLLKTAMGPEQVSFCEESVANQIQSQINPPIVNPPLPWETANEQ